MTRLPSKAARHEVVGCLRTGRNQTSLEKSGQKCSGAGEVQPNLQTINDRVEPAWTLPGTTRPASGVGEPALPDSKLATGEHGTDGVSLCYYGYPYHYNH